jgi:hypothetical protein
LLERIPLKMSEGSTFPIFIKPTLDDGSPAFAEFVRRAGTASKQAAESFKSDFREITAVLSNAVSKGVQGGKLDLDVSQLKQASAEAKLFQEALNGTLRTAQLLAKETGDNSAETRQYIVALESASKAQDENRRGIDAQIATYSRLQAALDVTADKNSKLAAAYRETFAEAARLARVEVDNRALGSTIAPAMGSRAVDNGAGYSELIALQDKLIQKEQLYASIATKNQQQVAGAVQFNKRATEEYAMALAQLRVQLDPVAAAQAIVNRELEFAALALKKGDISAAQYATRQQQLTASLRQAEGGFRDTRQGMIMVGQQVQDLGISLLFGQRASTVLAQQIPQLTFAFTSFGGKVGAAATALSSGFLPSVLLVAGSFGLGLLIDALIGADDAADKAKDAFIDLSSATARQKASITELKKAIDEYNESQEKQTRLTQYEIQLANNAAEADLRRAIAKRQLLAANLQEEQDRVDYLQRTQGGAVDSSLAQSAERRIKENEALIKSLQGEITNRTIELGEVAARAVDPLEAIRIKYDDIAAAATRAARANKGVAYGAPIGDVLSEISRQRRAEEEAYRRSQRTTQPRRSSQQALNDFIRELESRGIDVISSYRTAAKQNSLYRQGLTPLDGYARPSAHQAYRAVDVDKRTLNESQAYAAAQAAGIKGLRIVTESGGRKHLEFKGHGAPGEVDYTTAQRDAEKAAKAQEQLNRAIDQSSDSVSRLRGEFDRAPRDIDRANAAIDRLTEEIDKADELLKSGKLDDAQRKIVEETKRKALETRGEIIPDFKQRKVQDDLDAMQQQVDMQRLLLQGRRGEHDVLEDQLDLVRLLGGDSLDQLDTLIKGAGISDEQLDTYFRQREVLRAQNIELEKQQEKQQQLLQIVDDIQNATKSAIYDFFDGKGLGAAKNFINDLYDITKRQLTEEVFTKIFGDAFTNQKLKILGLDQVDKTGKEMASAIRVTIDPIRDLGNAAGDAARSLRAAANDNGIAAGLPGAKSASKNLGGLIPYSEVS